jgi:hypothetical protein
MHDTGVRMFVALIGVAKISMGINMHQSDGRRERVNHAHDRAIAQTMLTAQSHRHMARAAIALVSWRKSDMTVSIGCWQLIGGWVKIPSHAGFLTINQTLQLMRGRNNRRRPLRRSSAIGHRGFEATGYDFKLRRLPIIFVG